jgi:hypothetical protein
MLLSAAASIQLVKDKQVPTASLQHLRQVLKPCTPIYNCHTNLLSMQETSDSIATVVRPINHTPTSQWPSNSYSRMSYKPGVWTAKSRRRCRHTNTAPTLRQQQPVHKNAVLQLLLVVCHRAIGTSKAQALRTVQLTRLLMLRRTAMLSTLSSSRSTLQLVLGLYRCTLTHTHQLGAAAGSPAACPCQ